MLEANNPRIQVFKRFVEDLTTLSKCEDKKVAAIIIDKDATQVFSIGVNGGPKGGMNCLCKLGGKYTCAHAEANALAKCKVDCQGASMICSFSPCVTCATLIVNAGISCVYYIDTYKDDAGLNMLKQAGVSVVNLAEESKENKLIKHLWDELVKGNAVFIPTLDDSLLMNNLISLARKSNKILRSAYEVATGGYNIYLKEIDYGNQHTRNN